MTNTIGSYTSRGKRVLIPGKHKSKKKKKIAPSRRAKHRIRYFAQREYNGVFRYYWQPSTALREKGWQLTRLPNDKTLAISQAERINTELDEWRTANNLNPKRHYKAQTVGSAIGKYKRSMHFRNLRDSTKKNYETLLKIIEDWIGSRNIHSIRPHEIGNWYERRVTEQTHQAKAVVIMLRTLFRHACDRGDISVNPAWSVRLHQPAPRQQIWSDEAITVMVACAAELGLASVGTAIILGCCIGQRQGDILDLKWSQYEDGSFKITQSKTGKKVDVPASSLLSERLRSVPRLGETILVNEKNGVAYTQSSFRHTFDHVKERAVKHCPELENLWFLDLRRTAIVRLGEAGCTEAEIAAISGHSIESTRQILEVYLVRTSVMAENAIAKLEAMRLAQREENIEFFDPDHRDRTGRHLLRRCAEFYFDPLAVVAANVNAQGRRSLQ